MMFTSRLFSSYFDNGIEGLLQFKFREYELLVGVGVCLLVYLIRVVIKRAGSKCPPGPIGFPFIGYLPFLSKNVHLDFVELGKKYGDVFSVRLGTETIVVLNSGDVIKEAYAKPEFLGRPPHSVLSFFPYDSAFFMSDVHVWMEQRRFVVRSMKDLGLGKSKIEGEIQDEIHQFLDILRSHNGKPMDLKTPLSPSMSNNISALVFGRRLEFDDPDRRMLDENMEKTTDVSAQASAPTFFPWIRHVPFITRLLPIEKGIAAFKQIEKFVNQEIEQHKKTFDPKNIRDFIDSYLEEMKSRKMKDPNTTFSDEMLVGNVSDLFGAGSETVRTSILWCIYSMAAYQEVQKKVRTEILDVLGPDRVPEYLDHLKMPYTHAVILEMMRWKTIVPLNILHYTVADTSVGGYNVPKGMVIIANLWAVHHDPKVWDDPDAFKPERFLSKDGKSVVKPNNFMPFSFGKRTCPGETMANMEVFLYFTSILQKFHVVFPDGVKPTFNSQLTVTFKPETYLVRFISNN